MDVRKLNKSSAKQLPVIEPLKVKDDVVPPCATCDRCYTYLGRYVCYGSEKMYDPVKGIERPIELPCAVARDTAFCEYTQEELKAEYEKRAPMDLFGNIATLVGVFLALAACVTVFVFMVLDMSGNNEPAEFAITALMSIVIIVIMIASFVLFLALLKHGLETGFHSKDLVQMKENLVIGGNLPS